MQENKDHNNSEYGHFLRSVLVQLILIVGENYLVLSLPAESYIMKTKCTFIEVYHTGKYCPEKKI